MVFSETAKKTELNTNILVLRLLNEMLQRLSATSELRRNLWTVNPQPLTSGVKRKFIPTHTKQMATAFINALHWGWENWGL